VTGCCAHADLYFVCRKLKKNAPKEKTKLKFMQKYYHKGVFYMDDDSVRDKDDVRRREATGATLEDKFNKELMPQVMQVKNFGKSGRYVWMAKCPKYGTGRSTFDMISVLSRTKYTHLAAEDTSNKDSLWVRKDAYVSWWDGIGGRDNTDSLCVM
jgi:microfibrillar-associated protein 1